MQDIHCDGCGELTRSYDIVRYGSMERGYRQLCGRCFNTELAKFVGLEDFEQVRFEPVGLTDRQGREEIANDYQFVDSTYYRRNERYRPCGSQ
jgi:hypothetical protein